MRDVRVSLVCFSGSPPVKAKLDGKDVDAVFSDLSAGSADTTAAMSLVANAGIAKRFTWLANAHRDIDRAVVKAYGWPEKIADRAQPENPDAADREAAEEEILRRLFELNQKRAKQGR